MASRRPFLVPVLAFVLAAPVAVVSLPMAAFEGPAPRSGVADDPPSGSAPAAEEAKPESPVEAALEGARLALRDSDPKRAAALLKSLDVEKLDLDQARRYRILGQSAALRTGDRAWLEAVNAVPERYAFADGYAILTGWSYLKAADYERARFHLDLVKDFENLNEREKRRLLSLYARLEQLEGNVAAERVQIDKLVDYLGRWASPTCMGCHANESDITEIPTLDVNRHWIGERYAALLTEMGDAEAVRAAASRDLERRPEDERARLRLAYALRALGDEAGAIENLRALEWAAFPDREVLPPRDMIPFP